MSCPYSGNAEILRVCGAVSLRTQLAVAQKTIDAFAKESLRDQEKLSKAEKSAKEAEGYLHQGAIELAETEKRLSSVEKRAAQYKEAIRLWGRHKNDCVCNTSGAFTNACDCGFYDALKVVKDETEPLPTQLVEVEKEREHWKDVADIHLNEICKLRNSLADAEKGAARHKDTLESFANSKALGRVLPVLHRMALRALKRDPYKE